MTAGPSQWAQWALVAVIVAVCAAYAVRVLMPAGVRRALAGWLGRRGHVALAAKLDAGGSACDACARGPKTPAAR